jgi:hypothetical protein
MNCLEQMSLGKKWYGTILPTTKNCVYYNSIHTINYSLLFSHLYFSLFPFSCNHFNNNKKKVLAACGPMSVSFFTIVVFFGSFYLINLMLAVVALSYEEESQITNEVTLIF